MNDSVLIDTNILIYSIDVDSKFHERALNLLQNPTLDLFTTSKNISELLVVLTRSDQIKLSTSECLDIIKDILVDIHILFPNEATFSIFQNLINKYNPRGLWIHDVEIASIGIAYGITQIATNNVSDFKRIEEIEIIQI